MNATRNEVTSSQIESKYSAAAQCVIHHGHWRDLISQLPPESIDLTVTSPPYCMGKSYEGSRNVEDFRREHKAIIPRVINATIPGGSICWQVGYHVNQGILTPLDYEIHALFSAFPEIKLRNRIIWTFNSGLHYKHRFSGRHEVVLWYSKGDSYHFDLDAVRIPQKYPGKKHHKGDKRGQFSGNPLGKNPGDVWDIPVVKASSVEKTIHPCQFPIGLAQGLVKALSPVNGLILDPFLGSGSTAAAAVLEGLRFVGAETNDEYYRLAVDRVGEAMVGSLGFRPYGKPIERPTGAVARRPPHFHISD